MTTLHESPCGQPFSTAEDAASHQWHCDQCAGVLERLEAELDAMDSPPRWSHPHVEVMLPNAHAWGSV